MKKVHRRSLQCYTLHGYPSEGQGCLYPRSPTRGSPALPKDSRVEYNTGDSY